MSWYHLTLLRRLGKNYSGHRVISTLWGFSLCCFFVFLSRMKRRGVVEDTSDEVEMYHRLHTIFQKNKFGYHTRLFADFDNLLQGALNQDFINASINYYDDPVTGSEIEDVEAGLANDQSKEDIRNLLADKGAAHHDEPKCMVHPARHGLNYEKTDALSPYKVLPKGVAPKY